MTTVAAAGIHAPSSRMPEAVLLGAALVVPEMALAIAAVATVWSIRHRAALPSEEAVFLQAVALELRAGATVRSALESASMRSRHLPLHRVSRLAHAGAPMAEISKDLSNALTEHGVMAGAAVRTAGLTGGRVASVFDTLAHIAAEDRELVRERRAATAQARISAWIVGGLPMVFLGFGFVTGRLGDLMRSAVGVVVVGLGLVLIGSGVTTVVVMLRKALR